MLGPYYTLVQDGVIEVEGSPGDDLRRRMRPRRTGQSWTRIIILLASRKDLTSKMLTTVDVEKGNKPNVTVSTRGRAAGDDKKLVVPADRLLGE